MSNAAYRVGSIYGPVGSPQSLVCLVLLFAACIAYFRLPECFSQEFLAHLCFNPPDLSAALVAVISAGHCAVCVFLTPRLFAAISTFDHG